MATTATMSVVNSKWDITKTSTTQTFQATIPTGGKYCDKDINLKISAQGTTVSVSGGDISWGDGWVTAGSTTVQTGISPTGTITITQSTSTDVTNYATATVTGGTLGSKGGAVTGSNITLGTTDTSGISVTGSGQGTVTKAGWLNTGDATASSSTKYATGVNLKASTATKSFQIAVPNGSTTTTITFTFSVDSSGNVVIT